MSLEWLKDVGWVGTTIVALAGLVATVWTGRRSGQIQLTVQEKQLIENRRVLVWQERRAAYAQFLRQFQEYFDKTIIQEQLDALIKNGVTDSLEADGLSESALIASGLDEATAHQVISERDRRVRDHIQGEYGVLSMREGWVLLTQVRDAANQAQLIAPPSVQEGIDSLMRATDREEIEAAVKDELLVVEYRARIEAQKMKLNQVMNSDLLADSERIASK